MLRPSSLVSRAQERTQWAEVPHKASPRFGVSRTVIIEALPEDLPEDESYKMCGVVSPQQECSASDRAVLVRTLADLSPSSGSNL